MGWSPGQDDVEPGPPPRRSCSSSALAERGQHKLLLTCGIVVPTLIALEALAADAKRKGRHTGHGKR